MSKALVTQIQTTFETLDVDELQKLSGIPADVFNELRELGALDEFFREGVLPANTVVVFKIAGRLWNCFQLVANSLALLIHFIGESQELRRQIRKIYRTNPYL